MTRLIIFPDAKSGAFVIPDGVTEIAQSAFSGCTGLSSVFIPNSVTHIWGAAFSRCTGLSTVSIPDSVLEIDYSAFKDCSALTTIFIPASVTKVEESTFDGCTNLTEINVDSLNSHYQSLDGVLFNEEMTFLIQFPSGKPGEFTIPDSVTNIGYAAFQDCHLLTSLMIGNGVTSIWSGAFYGCSSLASLSIPASVTELGSPWIDGSPRTDDSPFSGLSNLISINVHPDNEIYRSVDGVLFNKSQNTLIQYPTGRNGAYTIPDGVQWIGGFKDCVGLTSISIPDSVTHINHNAFSNCIGLTSITLPDGIIEIRDSAFSGCSALTSITIPEGVTSISPSTFSDCPGLTSVDLPEESHQH